MKTITTIKPLRKGYAASPGPVSKTIPTTIHVISKGGQTGLRHSLRGSAAGKIWKKTVRGDKFEYAKKLEEKRNYVLYASGMGHEKKQIQEIEQIPQPPEKAKIVEERQIIDNYGYHETKNIKKNDPKRLSITRHERLSTPYERRVIKQYDTHTSQPKQVLTTSTTAVKNPRIGNDFSGLKAYNSFTAKTDKKKTVTPPKLFETYKPGKPVNKVPPYTQTKTTKTITTEKNPAKTTTSYNKYQVKTTTTTSSGKTVTNITKLGDKKDNAPKINLNKYSTPKNKYQYKPQNKPENKPQNKLQNKPENKPPKKPENKSQYKPQYKPQYKLQFNRADTEPNFKRRNDNVDKPDKDYQKKVETKRDGDYLIKITTTTRKQTNEEKPFEKSPKPLNRTFDVSRSGSTPRGGQKPSNEGQPKNDYRTKSGSKNTEIAGNHYLYGPLGQIENRKPKPVYFGPHGTYGPGIMGTPQPFRPGDYLDKDGRPRLSGRPPHGFGPHATGFMPHGFGPHGPGFGPHGFGPHGPGFGPHGFGPHGPGFGPHATGFIPHGFGPHGPGFGPHGFGPHATGFMPHGFGPHGPGFGPHGPGFGGPRENNEMSNSFTQKSSYQMKRTVTSGGRGENSEAGAGRGGSSSYSKYKRNEKKGNVGQLNKSTDNISRYQVNKNKK